MENNDYEYLFEYKDENGKTRWLTASEYSKVISPASLYRETTPDELYVAWKNMEPSVGELQSALEYFEADEMYLHCVAIKKLIDEVKIKQ